MNLAKKAFHGVEMQYRADSHDHYVFTEVAAYTKNIPLKPTDTVMDVGGHIGSFTVLAAATAKAVHTFEPHPENFKLLSMNTKKLKNVTVNNLAVVGAGDRRTELSLFVQSTNTGGHSIQPHRGRGEIKVKAEAVDKLFKLIKPTYLKLDCETAEYDIVLSMPMPKSIRAIVAEIHFGKQQNLLNAERLDASLLEQGFRHIKAPNIRRGLWHTNAYYVR